MAYTYVIKELNEVNILAELIKIAHDLPVRLVFIRVVADLVIKGSYIFG